jgi:NADH:ubiquinone oxidoreductase subunit 2 (subunit N)
MALVPLLLLDLVYWWRRAQADQVRTVQIAALAATLGGLPALLFFIGQWYAFPTVTLAYSLQTLVFGVPLCLATAWYGYQIGRVLQQMGGTERAPLSATRQVLLQGAVGVVLMLLFTAWFVVTATPPIA